MLVYARTHTQTTWVLDESPGVGQTPGGPEESKRLKRSIHVDCIGVHSTFVYIYDVLRVLMIWAKCFFLLTCLFFYHLSIWPLSRGELIPRLDKFIFF